MSMRASRSTDRRVRPPALTWDGFAWSGTMLLPTWKGFQRRGRTPSRAVPKVQLELASPDGEGAPPAPEQLAACAYLRAHEQAITKAVLARVLRAYPKLRGAYHAASDITPGAPADDDPDLAGLVDDAPKELPVIKRAADLRQVMSINTIHVLNVAKRGHAYVGLQFHCDWDDEHGAGVMLHQRRVVAFGGADTSFLEWIATRDGGQDLAPAAPKPPAPRAPTRRKRSAPRRR